MKATASAVDPRAAAIEKESRAHWTKQFKLLATMTSLVREFNDPADAGLALEFVERGLSADEARRELASRAAVRSWSGPLGAQSPIH